MIRSLPEGVAIGANDTALLRYAKLLSGREVSVLRSEDIWSFRPIFRQLRLGRPIFIALDTAQAAFQVIARYAFRRRVGLIPVRTSKSGTTTMVPLETGDARVALEELQRYLFESYMGGPRSEPIHLFNELLAAAKFYGEHRVICKDISGQVTYKDTLLGAYVLSRKLRSSISRQDARIGVLLPNSIGHVVTLFALFYNGQSPVVLNFSAGVQTIVDACETADLGTILTSREFIVKGQLESVDEVLRKRYKVIYLEDVRSSISMFQKVSGVALYMRRKRAVSRRNEMVLFTSGSEYKPRGIVLSHANIFANVQQTRSVIDFETSHRILNSMPMFHSFGLTAGMFLPLLTGIQTYLYPSPLHYKRIPELVSEEKSTVLFGTSSFLERYGENATPEQFASLRYAIAGAERLKSEVEQYWLDKFHLQIRQGYGATETSPIMSLDTPVNHAPNTVGRLLPEMSYRLMPIEGIDHGGILQVKGPNVMEGYLAHGQGYIRQDGWYDTGDIVTVDEDRFVRIIGRLKRFAKIAGEMVSLNLIEQLASQVYRDASFAAINLPDPKRGERIVLTTTTEGLSLRPLRSLIDDLGYSRLYIPSELYHVDVFPLLGSGKIDYVALKSHFM